MLVRFHSQAGQSLLMFGDDARALLILMGMSGNIPGAVAPEDIRNALDRLSRALELTKTQAKGVARVDKAPDALEVTVGMSVRAYPLVQLLQLAERHKRAVVWESETSGT